MDTTHVLQYYRQHSTLTNPGVHATLYNDLPQDVAGLTRSVQEVLICPLHLSLYNVQREEIDNTGFGLRRMEDLLARIQQRNATPLTSSRPPTLRIGAICRNFAVLLVSMLREQGIPARARVGFGAYFPGPLSYDHRIAEYWDSTTQRWILADPMIWRCSTGSPS